MYGSAKCQRRRLTCSIFPPGSKPIPATSSRIASRILREVGKPFNIGVKTLNNELLEADGRVAGGMATLRFRPLSGERQQITELNYDARKLGMQVERLSAVLDSAPLPVWLRDGEGKLTWVNQAYVKAVEMPDSDQVLKSLIEIAAPDRIDTTKADPKVRPRSAAPTRFLPAPCGPSTSMK